MQFLKYLLFFSVLTACHHPTESETKRIKMEYDLVFEDHFNGPALDTAKWLSKTQNPKPFDRVLPRSHCGYQNAAVMLEANVLLNNGQLNLIARKESYRYSGIVEGGKGQAIGCGFVGGEAFDLNQSYTSASICATRGYNHGYFECKAKIPATLGLYPVFWLWHHDEIVVFEFFGNSTAHYLSAHNKEKYVSQQFNTVANYSDHFHTYATHWTPHTITWYFDDEAIHSISRADSDPAVKVAFPDSTNRWLRPHLSLRMYEWAERIDEANLPDTLKVDYIKIYQNKKI